MISIPAQALIFNKNGLSAAVYEDGIVRIRQLNLLADNGAEVDVRTGLKPEDKIILSPPINIRDGMHVTAAGSGGNVDVGSAEGGGTAAKKD